MKDAVRTKTPGQWGAEVPWGDGEVGGAKFLTALAATGYRGPVAIEREAGNARFADIEKAVRRLTV
jgi:sugar phosphate isomerase/epimerase